ncbi:MAG: DUF4345 domain-containing protein [Proteobacteria bacterium]|nr:DUF4345 domain-containing protein [Pseudomonadota bacterium]
MAVSAQERKLLQVCITTACLVPILAGIGGILKGTDLLSWGGSIDLDSHFRYLSGLLLAIGLGFLSTVKEIEKHTVRFQTLSAIVVIGGLGRLYGVMLYGAPNPPMEGALVMELLVTPGLCWWQARVAIPPKNPPKRRNK